MFSIVGIAVVKDIYTTLTLNTLLWSVLAADRDFFSGTVTEPFSVFRLKSE